MPTVPWIMLRTPPARRSRSMMLPGMGFQTSRSTYQPATSSRFDPRGRSQVAPSCPWRTSLRAPLTTLKPQAARSPSSRPDCGSDPGLRASRSTPLPTILTSPPARGKSTVPLKMDRVPPP